MIENCTYYSCFVQSNKLLNEIVVITRNILLNYFNIKYERKKKHKKL